MNDFYSEEEALRLGRAIPLAVDELPCDLDSCPNSGAVLIPGASVCSKHAEQFGLGHLALGQMYNIPVAALTGDARWRCARRELWIERSLDLPLVRRTPEQDRLLARLAEFPIDEVFEDW